MMCLYLLSYSIELRVGEPLEPGDLLSLGRLLLLLGRGARLPRTEVKDGSKDQANSYDAQCSALCAHVCMYMCENVAVDKRKEVWSKCGMILEPQLEEIYQKYSTEEQRMHACADIYVNCNPESLWTDLCRRLFNMNEMSAARKATTFIPRTGG